MTNIKWLRWQAEDPARKIYEMHHDLPILEPEAIKKIENWKGARSITMDRKHLRDVDQLIKDGIGSAELYESTHGRGKRISALIEVLGCMPDLDYRRINLVLAEKRFIIYAPQDSIGGEVRDGLGADLIVYLAPRLEKVEDPRVKWAVAHEISHLILHHDFPERPVNELEEEANSKARSWGYRNWPL